MRDCEPLGYALHAHIVHTASQNLALNYPFACDVHRQLENINNSVHIDNGISTLLLCRYRSVTSNTIRDILFAMVSPQHVDQGLGREQHFLALGCLFVECCIKYMYR